MKLVDFIYGLVDRFCPLDAESKASLKLDAQSSYNKVKEEAFRKKAHNKAVETDGTIPDDEKEGLKEKMSLLDKAMVFAEGWIFRTVLAMAFILVVPKIKNYWSSGGPSPDTMDMDDADYDDEDY